MEDRGGHARLKHELDAFTSCHLNNHEDAHELGHLHCLARLKVTATLSFAAVASSSRQPSFRMTRPPSTLELQICEETSVFDNLPLMTGPAGGEGG